MEAVSQVGEERTVVASGWSGTEAFEQQVAEPLSVRIVKLGACGSVGRCVVAGDWVGSLRIGGLRLRNPWVRCARAGLLAG